MVTKKFIPVTHNRDFPKLMLELTAIQKNYNCFICSIRGNKLICEGKIQPTHLSREYYVKISYEAWKKPKVWIINPTIEYNEEIHMYKDDNNLCLYYHVESPWKHSYHLYDKIIPWTSEWLIYYELYQITGKWFGIEQKHSSPKRSD